MFGFLEKFIKFVCFLNFFEFCKFTFLPFRHWRLPRIFANAKILAMTRCFCENKHSALFAKQKSFLRSVAKQSKLQILSIVIARISQESRSNRQTLNNEFANLQNLTLIIGDCHDHFVVSQWQWRRKFANRKFNYWRLFRATH